MPTGTLLNADDRSRLIQRLRQVRPDVKPAWGTLDAPRMVCHLADSLRIALGDVPAKPVHNFASRTLLKHLVISSGLQPPRGKIQTAPEMLSSRPAVWEADLAACVALTERVGTGAARAVHPMFGPLSPGQWGRLSWKHMNHHLVQFGV